MKRKTDSPNRRSLKTIEASLAKSLAAKDKSELECGQWLIEAKDQLEHGEWLTWLDAHFPHSVSTAERWVGVAALCTKFVKLTNLKITKGGLYALADEIDEIDDRIISAIVKAAAESPKWIKEHDIRPILYREREAKKLKREAKERGITAAELKQEREQQAQERQRRQEEWQREQAEAVVEADAILDAPPDDDDDDAPPQPVEAPVGERPSQDKFVYDTLTNAVERLDTIVSKPMHVLVDAPVPSDVLERAGRFLLDIVDAR